MKRHTGIIVIVLLTLIIVNNIYYPVGHTGVEGFDIHSKWAHNEADTFDRYIITVSPLLKKVKGQTDLVFLKAQLLNILKMFNANFEAYIQKVYNTKDFLNPNISVDLINGVITQLFDYLKSVVDSAKNTEGDGSLTNDARNSIKTYFFTGFTQLFKKLASLKHKPEVGSSGATLFTNEQITDYAYTGEPSIKHFTILCDDNSSIAKQLNGDPVDPTGVHMEFFISNSINNANNSNFLLQVYKDTAELQNTTTQFSDYASSLRFTKNASSSDPTLDDILGDVVANTADVYKISQSNTEGPFLAILILSLALGIAIVYYFYDSFGGSVASSVSSAYNTASNAVSGATANMSANVSANVTGIAGKVGNAVSVDNLTTTMNNAGGGLFLFHGFLLILILILYLKYHGGDTLDDLEDVIEEGTDRLISMAVDEVENQMGDGDDE